MANNVFSLTNLANVNMEPTAQLASARIRAEAEDMFNSIDIRGDEKLSHTQIKNFLKKEPQVRLLLAGDNFHWKDFFEAMDTDEDGRIQKNEFIRFYEHVMGIGNNENVTNKLLEFIQGRERKEELNSLLKNNNRNNFRSEALALFKIIDKDHDGSLSHTEIKKFLSTDPSVRLLLAGHDFHWKDFFAALDTDKDGLIQPEEFIKFYEKSVNVDFIGNFFDFLT